MDYSVSFSRHFARLLWLLLHEPANIDEQKAALRALVTIVREGPVRFSLTGSSVAVNGQVLPAVFPGLEDLAGRLAWRDGSSLDFESGAAPAVILGAARELAGARPAPQAATEVKSPRVTTAFQALGVIPAEEDAGSATPGDFAAPPEEQSSGDAAAAAPVDGLVATAGADLFFQFAGSAPTGTPAEILGRFDSAAGADARGRALEELVLAVEQAARDARPLVVAELLLGLADREERAGDDARRAVTLAFRRAAKDAPLRMLASLLPRKADLRDGIVRVLHRAGEDGADAVIDQLSHAQQSDDRRVYFDVLLQLNAGVPALLHMLGDPRWFVARNAAELLGEMRAMDAERPLAAMLRHADERVRRAATESLLRLNTPASVAAVESVAQDGDPAIRVGAIAALGKTRDGNTATTLVRALDSEADEEVQVALIAALGKVATPDAVQRLVKAAEQDGRFFRKKSGWVRAAALLALGEARTPEALAAIRAHLDDRDPEVREAALRAIALARRSGPVS